MKLDPICCALILVSATGMMRSASADNPHEITMQSDAIDCTSCHKKIPKYEKPGVVESKYHLADHKAFSQDGVAMCTECHDAGNGHQVGIKLDFEIPADLPLGARNKMTCLTCHYTHGAFSSDKPQASFSFLDILLNSKRLHKSYLLRRNNSDGELCLICHEVNAGAQ